VHPKNIKGRKFTKKISIILFVLYLLEFLSARYLPIIDFNILAKNTPTERITNKGTQFRNNACDVSMAKEILSGTFFFNTGVFGIDIIQNLLA
jgi:hypothetical protein